MPLTPTALTQPVGPLAPSFFPSDDATAFTARLQAYLDQAYAQVAGRGLSDATADQAAQAWAEYRAYGDVYTALLRAPASAELPEQGQRAYLITQMQEWRTLRDDARARYNALVPVVTASSVVARPPAASSSTVHEFTW